MVKRILVGAIIVLVVIQFIRPARNVSTEPPGKNDITTVYHPPADVQKILEFSCYDCHSNNTRYPWYVNIQPVGWYLADHVKDGKRSLNFNAFGSYPLKRQAKKLDAISDEVTERSMPLRSYLLIHRTARLTDAQVRAVADWADALHDKIAPDNDK